MKKPVTFIIVGAGNRAMIYANYAKKHPEEMQIIGVAEPNPVRRQEAQKIYDISDNMCFESVEELCKREKLADAVINGTMDVDHVPTTKLLVKAGYDVLLEKPFAVNETEMFDLVETAKRYNRKVVVCHVLRYTPFYQAIKELVLSKELGAILNIQLTEHVSYHHIAAAFVRGKWASEKECHASMLLAKSCHDLDLMMWMMDETEPLDITSFGSDFTFGKNNKPAQAGTRCMVDCPIEKDCIHSARRNYLADHNRWAPWVWSALETEGVDVVNGYIHPYSVREESLKADNPFGRCVWDCERDGNVDHQSVMVRFKNGATGTFNMIGNTSRPERSIHIIGTKGEVKGIFDDSTYSIRKPAPETESGYIEEIIDLNIMGDKTGAHGGHGGGDLRIPEDFIKYIRGEEPSVSCSSIEKSVVGHLAVFRADQARRENRIVSMEITAE